MRKYNDLLIDVENTDSLNPEIVGAKATSLFIMKKANIKVPHFFSISSTFIIDDLESDEFCCLLRIKFNELKKNYKSIIVRSSANIEDNENSLFPGIFKSKRGVRSFNDLIQSIKYVYVSKKEKTVAYYCRLKNIDINKIQLSLIIQGEILPHYSGVIFTQSPLNHNLNSFYLEIIKGSNDLMLSGLKSGAAFEISLNNITSINNKFKFPISISNELIHIITQLKQIFEKELDIEWAYSDQLFILQARPLIDITCTNYLKKVSKEIKKTNIKECLLFPDEKEMGLKGASMKYFIENKMFNVKATLISPHTSLDKIKEKLRKLAPVEKGITIRFSHKNEIGLPRFFVKNIDEALQVIHDHWNENWLIIAHEYFIVKDSFEIYLENEKYLIEHIPGMWESENILEPDVILNEKGKTTYLRYSEERVCKYVSYNAEIKKIVSPVAKTHLKSWNKNIEPLIERLRRDFFSNLPLNIHYVETDKNEYIFLNIRKTQYIKNSIVKKTFFHIVNDISTLNSWDGKQDILLQVPIERGYEKLLQVIAKGLPKNKDNIYVNFGILSHPAIMLRELGIHVIPVYLKHEIFN